MRTHGSTTLVCTVRHQHCYNAVEDHCRVVSLMIIVEIIGEYHSRKQLIIEDVSICRSSSVVHKTKVRNTYINRNYGRKFIIRFSIKGEVL